MGELTKSQRTAQRRASRTDEEVLADQERLRPEGIKKCPQCDHTQPLDKYGKDRLRADGLTVKCSNCISFNRRGIQSDVYYKKCRGCNSVFHVAELASSARCQPCQNEIDSAIEEEKRQRRELKAQERKRRKSLRVCKDCGVEKRISDFPDVSSGKSRLCDECIPQRPTSEILLSGKRYCTKCRIEFPLSEFVKDSKSSTGRGTLCTNCRVEVNTQTSKARAGRSEEQILADRKRLRPTGRKTCSKCHKEYSLNEFGRNVYMADGCGQWCKRCIRTKNAKTSQINLMRTDEEVEAKRNQLRPEGLKACRYCRKSLPFNNFHTNKRYPDGLSQTCTTCTLSTRAGREWIIKSLIDLYGRECLHPDCDSTELTIDHVVPVSKGGAHDIGNYQQLCRMHNSQKSDRTVDYRPL